MGSFLVAATIFVPAVSAACAPRVGNHDAEYRDDHRWDAREERAYRWYWEERHERYRDGKKPNEREQRDDWKWRHDYPDRN